MTEQLFFVPFPAVPWQDATAVRIAVAGEIDLATSPQVQAVMLAGIEAATPSGDVNVDLANVTFLDASGVRVLITGREAARCRGVGFTVYNAQSAVQRVFDILGLTTTLQYLPRGRRSAQRYGGPRTDEVYRTVNSPTVAGPVPVRRWYTSPFHSWRRPWQRLGQVLHPPR